MDLLAEIKENFAAGKVGMRPLKNLPPSSPAYTVRIGSEYGVAIEFHSKKPFYEESANTTMRSQEFLVNGKVSSLLVLTCCDEAYRNEFADLCFHFVAPGENRQLLISNPLEWWNQWTSLLGNRKSQGRCYDVLAELIVLDSIFIKDDSVQWTASHAGSHDIETNEKCFEVKSTVKKNETSVTISSQHQLFSEKDLELHFLRLELSENGKSINDMKEQLVLHGYDEAQLESQLEERGFKLGSSIRDRKFVLLEKRIYKVDDTFPKITATSFKNDVFPQNITKILYTIDLEGIAYSTESSQSSHMGLYEYFDREKQYAMAAEDLVEYKISKE